MVRRLCRNENVAHGYDAIYASAPPVMLSACGFVHQKSGNRKVPGARIAAIRLRQRPFPPPGPSGRDAFEIVHGDGSGRRKGQDDLSEVRNTLSIIIRDASSETMD